MPTTIDELSTQFAGATAELDQILKAAEGENRPLSDEETKRYDELEAQADKLQAEIDRIDADQKRRQRQAARQKRLAKPRPRQTTPPDPGDDLSLPGEWNAEERAEVRRQHHRAGKLRGFEGPGAAENAYRSGQWLAAVLYGHEPAMLWCREHGIESLAMGTDSNPKGGALVIPEFESAVISLREEYGLARQICAVKPMGSDEKTFPRRSTGLTAYPIGDNEAITESEKSWDDVGLVARKWGVLTKHSSELDEDAIINLADDLADEISYAFASAEDGCLLLGDGTSTYHGIIGVKNAVAAGSVYTAIAGNLTFGSLDLEDFESMIGQLPEFPGIDPVWVISKAGWAASMLRLAAAAGGNTMEILENGTRRRVFLGYPVKISQKMNKVLTSDANATGKVYFGDFRLGALLGDRRQVRVKVSTDRYFEYDQIGILGTERMDINVHGRGDASNAGPIISMTLPAA